jgi:hypothetical protein
MGELHSFDLFVIPFVFLPGWSPAFPGENDAALQSPGQHRCLTPLALE